MRASKSLRAKTWNEHSVSLCSNGIFLAVHCAIGLPPDIQKSVDCCIIMHNMVRENRRSQYTVLQWLARKNNDDDRDVSDNDAQVSSVHV